MISMCRSHAIEVCTDIATGLEILKKVLSVKRSSGSERSHMQIYQRGGREEYGESRYSSSQQSVKNVYRRQQLYRRVEHVILFYMDVLLFIISK